jgi:arylsulfatase A-like enzyme
VRRRAAIAIAAALALVACAGAWFALQDSRDSGGSTTYASDGRLLRDVRVPRQLPNLVVLVLDTLRADAVEPGGASRVDTATPFLGSLAARGVHFVQASSNSPWTMPAAASLLTGLHPSRHGAFDSRQAPALPAAVTTVAELLAHAYGYDTAALVDTAWLGGPDALGQGFSRYEDGFWLEDSAARLGSWAQAREPGRPFFLYVHTLEPHDPYGRENRVLPDLPAPRPGGGRWSGEPWEAARTYLLDGPRRRHLMLYDGPRFFDAVLEYTTYGYARDPRPELVAELRSAYREGVRWADAGVERFVAALEGLGALENTLLVVTSDHGEAFGEHGILGHGRFLHDEILRVPLVMVGPEPFRGGKIVSSSVGLADVLPTFLDLAGLAPLDDVDGRSFLRVVDGDEYGWPVLAEELRHPLNAFEANDVLVASARSEGWKYVLTYDLAAQTFREELYDLLLDPAETTNLADAERAPPLDPDFCRAVARVRLNVEEAATARAGSGRAVGRPGPTRPEPCGFH